MNHNEDPNILVHPRKNKGERPVPDTGVLLVNPSEAARAHKLLKEGGGKSRFLFNSKLSIAQDRSFFVAGPSIGAPMAVLSLEKLIALGAKRIILFGWCGAIAKNLSVGDMLIPSASLSGEGTSLYYTGDNQVSPSSRLNTVLGDLLLGNKLSFSDGCVWSTDALYREDRRFLDSLQVDKSVSAVDMEFSALCSVANFRKIQFSALLVVSDELWGTSWKPGFTSAKFKQQCDTALMLLLENINHI